MQGSNEYTIQSKYSRCKRETKRGVKGFWECGIFRARVNCWKSSKALDNWAAKVSPGQNLSSQSMTLSHVKNKNTSMPRMHVHICACIVITKPLHPKFTLGHGWTQKLCFIDLVPSNKALALVLYKRPRFRTCIVHHRTRPGWNPLKATNGPQSWVILYFLMGVNKRWNFAAKITCTKKMITVEDCIIKDIED